MPYMIKAHDYPGTLQRRMEVRERHFEALSGLKEAGKVLFAAALLNDGGEMAGSTLIVDMTLEEVQAMLAAEPYLLHGVWDKERIEVIPCKPAPGFGR